MDWLDTAIKVLLSSISFLLIAGVFYLLGRWLWRKLHVRREREHTLHIHHQANFRAFYYLAVESPEPRLGFRFLVGNKPLAEVSHPFESKPVGNKTKAASSVKPAQQKPAQVVGGAPQAAMAGAMDGGRQVAAKAGVAANLLGIVGGILPGSMGRKFKEQQEQVRQAQQQVVKTSQAPQDAQRRFQALQSESQKLGVKIPNASLPASNHQSRGPGTVEGQPQSPVGFAAQTPFAGLYCVQTVDVEPGQTLPIKLQIDFAGRQRLVGSYVYSLHLQAIPAEPLQENIPSLTRRGTVYFAPVAVWRLWMPGFAGLLTMLMGLLAWLYLAQMIWK